MKEITRKKKDFFVKRNMCKTKSRCWKKNMQKILFNIFFTLWCMKVFRMTLNDRWIFSYEIKKTCLLRLQMKQKVPMLASIFLYYNNSWVNPLSSQMSACCLLISLCCACCFSVFPVHEAYSIFQDSPLKSEYIINRQSNWLPTWIRKQIDTRDQHGRTAILAKAGFVTLRPRRALWELVCC